MNFIRLFEIKFVAEFVASLLIGFTAFSLFSLGIGKEVDKVVVGSIMPLVPGLLITNAVRDLMAGHLISGLAKGRRLFNGFCNWGRYCCYVCTILEIVRNDYVD